MRELLSSIRDSYKELLYMSSVERNKILLKMAKAISENRDYILKESIDNDEGYINEDDIDNMVNSIIRIKNLDDPIGKIVQSKNKNGFKVLKTTAPIGVILMVCKKSIINVEHIAMCIKSSNALILNIKNTSYYTNSAIMGILKNGLNNKNIIHLFSGINEHLKELLCYDEYIDVVVSDLAQESFIKENAKMPVINIGIGICHLYIHSSSNFDLAIDVAVKSKISEGLHSEVDTVLVDYSISKEILPKLITIYSEYNIGIRGCNLLSDMLYLDKANQAKSSDYHKKTAKIVNIKIVNSVFEAINHINRHSNSGIETIMTKDIDVANRFLDEVDSAYIYLNPLPHLMHTNMAEYNLGFSSNRLLVRGFVGIDDLVTSKYRLYGEGGVRS